MIYLDAAATSYPKPPSVLAAMSEYLRTAGNPGRSGHRLSQAGEAVLWDARERLAAVLDGDDPSRVVLTLNATTALNMAIKGLALPGRRVLTSAFEHNAVVRPLHSLRETGVVWAAVPPAPDSPIDLDAVERELRAGDVSLIVVTHASNVTGAVIPLAAVHALATDYEVPLLVDAAQTAGDRPVSARTADVLVVAGHKGLLGPQGTGGLYVSERVSIRPLLHGGTGGRSEQLEQPQWLPFALEAGTPNGVGIAGLAAAVSHVTARDVAARASITQRLRTAFVAELRSVPGVLLHEWPSREPPVGVVSITFEGRSPIDAAAMLEERHDVLTRAGLHCAPLAHRTLGTFSNGTVRLSFSDAIPASDLDAATEAVRDVARSAVAARSSRA
jgi:cysteine desulfurase family protein